jgi:hypothetical protein
MPEPSLDGPEYDGPADTCLCCLCELQVREDVAEGVCNLTMTLGKDAKAHPECKQAWVAVMRALRTSFDDAEDIVGYRVVCALLESACPCCEGAAEVDGKCCPVCDGFGINANAPKPAWYWDADSLMLSIGGRPPVFVCNRIKRT